MYAEQSRIICDRHCELISFRDGSVIVFAGDHKKGQGNSCMASSIDDILHAMFTEYHHDQIHSPAAKRPSLAIARR